MERGPPQCGKILRVTWDKTGRMCQPHACELDEQVDADHVVVVADLQTHAWVEQQVLSLKRCDGIVF